MDYTTAEERTVMEPAPLPEDLWKRLIERYIDPADAEGKTYKKAGPSSNLAGFIGPPDPRPEKQKSPEARLSHYFSKVLYPEIIKGNDEVRKRFRAL